MRGRHRRRTAAEGLRGDAAGRFSVPSLGRTGQGGPGRLKAVYRDFKDRGLEIVGISLDTEKPLVDAFLKKAALPWKLACSWNGWEDATAKLYQISATPSTWPIDRRGVVRCCDVRGDELRKAVETLVGEGFDICPMAIDGSDVRQLSASRGVGYRCVRDSAPG